MTLLFDLIAAQPEGSSPVSGGGEYTRRVAGRLFDRSGDYPSLDLHCVYQNTKRIDDEVLGAARAAGATLHRVDAPSEMSPLAATIGADRFFSALPLRYARRNARFPRGCEVVGTIHGLRPLELPWDGTELHYAYNVRSVLRHLVPRIGGRRYLEARRREIAGIFTLAERVRIVAVSEHTVNAIYAHFPEARDVPVHLFYSPTDEAPVLGADEEARVLREFEVEPRSYYLVIAANRWGKNGYRTLRALDSLRKTGVVTRPTVVLGTGRAPYLRRYRGQGGGGRRANGADQRDHGAGPTGDGGPRLSDTAAGPFRLSDYVDRITLHGLYKNAFAFLFPSLNEGFGYPPLECMAYGTPVLTSGVSSLPELGGDAVLTVDPRSQMELSTRITQLERDDALRERLARRGVERAGEIRRRQEQMMHELVDVLAR